MALVGNMIADAKSGNPSIVNYAMFVSVFGMLSLFYLIAGTISETFAISPFFMIAADALNTLFFLVGGIALAAYLNVHSCGNQVSWSQRARPGTTRLMEILGLRQEQWHNQRLEQPKQKMSRGASCDGVPMVRFRSLLGLAGLLHTKCARWNHINTHWHPKRWARHVTGLEDW